MGTTQDALSSPQERLTVDVMIEPSKDIDMSIAAQELVEQCASYEISEGYEAYGEDVEELCRQLMVMLDSFAEIFRLRYAESKKISQEQGWKL